MGRRFDIVEMLIQLEKHLLRELFGRSWVAQEMVRQAVHHRLVLPNQRGERTDRAVVRQIPLNGFRRWPPHTDVSLPFTIQYALGQGPQRNFFAGSRYETPTSGVNWGFEV